MGSRVIFLLAAAALYACPAAAQTLHMQTYPLGPLVESQSLGSLVALTKDVAQRAGLDIKIEMAPFAASIKSFCAGKADGFFPSTGDVPSCPAARSSVAVTIKEFIFFKKGDTYKSLDALWGKRVGATVGYPYASLRAKKHISLRWAPTDAINMRKLAMGAIDAFIIEEKRGLEAITKVKATNIEYDNANAFDQQELTYAFADTPEGKDLASKFSKVLAETAVQP